MTFWRRESDHWEVKTIFITNVDVNELKKLDSMLTAYCFGGWEPWSWVKGGSEWIVSFKRLIRE